MNHTQRRTLGEVYSHLRTAVNPKRQSWLGRGLALALVLSAAVAGLSTDAYAGSDTKTTLKDGFTFRASYGSTEVRSFSLINYVYVDVTAPGFRSYAEVTAIVSIYSQGVLVRQQEVRQSYGPSFGHTTKAWYVYAPAASNRAQVRRGQNTVRIDYKYVQIGWTLNPSWMGTTSISFTLP